MMDSIEALSAHPLFGCLSKWMLADLAAACRRRRLDPGETLFHEDDPGSSLYVILSGSVELSRLDAYGEKVFIAERGPGEIVGEMAVFDGKPRSATARTSKASTFLILDREQLLNAVRKSPEISLALIATLSQKLRDNEAGRMPRSTVRQRLAKLLLDTATEQEGPKGKPIKVGASGLTRKAMGDRIGARRETVSRELSWLADAGHVRLVGGTIVIRNPAGLESLCDPLS